MMASYYHVEEHVFDWRPEYPLVTTAKRYTPQQCAEEEEQRGDQYALVLAHGTGFHNEQWEPTLRHLFARPAGRPREAWAVSCPNHGDAAVLNEAVLLAGGPRHDNEMIFSWDEYTKVLYLFLTQFHRHKVIGLGHSMGAVAIAMTQTYPSRPAFEALILCEPMTLPTGESGPALRLLAGPMSWPALTLKRRDAWSSRQELAADLASKGAFQRYDPAVLRAYLDHGFRDLPTRLYPDKQGLTLKTMRAHEAACYRDRLSPARFYDFLPALTARVPVHIIWGEMDDAIPRPVKDRITDACRRPASVSRIKAAGHLVVQMAPKGLADAIRAIILGGKNTLGTKL